MTTKSGLNEQTSHHIRETAEFLIPAHTDEEGRVFKEAIQHSVFRELISEDDADKVVAAIGATKASWLFDGLRFTIYELLRHKIRNMHKQFEKARGGSALVKVREIQQVFAGPTSRVAKLTLKLQVWEIDLVVGEYDKQIKTLQRERNKFRLGARKMREDPIKYPTLAEAWGIKPVALKRGTRGARRRKTKKKTVPRTRASA